MYNQFKSWIMNFMKIPPDPEAPAGDAGSLHVFRASPNYLKYKLYVWMIRSAFAALFYGIFFVALLIAILKSPTGLKFLITLLELLLISFAFIQIFVDYVTLRLDYELRWYMVTDRSLRIREGVWMVREMTMTFANIQNISISQGPIQRYFNIADLKVETAGGGGGMVEQEQQGSFNMHIGYFRGVDNAEEIRDLMMKRLRNLKDSGLGDIDDEREDQQTVILEDQQVSGEMLDILKLIYEETKRYRTNTEALAHQSEL